uniref:Uncharacterized protein n=1 Tax=Lepeophtheirus salmonis TaxID=72036 RepID=A0A0K2T180_LEPSM
MRDVREEVCSAQYIWSNLELKWLDENDVLRLFIHLLSYLKCRKQAALYVVTQGT